MNSEKAQRMFALVDQWRASGMTKKEFCSQQDIKLATFGYWITKKNRMNQEDAVGFVTITPSDPVSSPDYIEIIYPNGVRLSVAPGSGQLISQLIRAW